MWKRDEAVTAASTDELQVAAASTPEPSAVARRDDASAREGHGEHREKRHHQGRAERQRRSDDRRSGRGQDRARQNVLTIGPNGKIKAQMFAKAVVVQGEVHGQHHRERARRHPRQRDRSTAICRRRAWRLPTARTSAAASTCRRAARRPSRSKHRRRASRSRPRRRRRPTTVRLATGHRGDAGSVAERRRSVGPRSRAWRVCSTGADGNLRTRQRRRLLWPHRSLADTLTTSKVLPRFMAALAHEPAPVLLDLGPVVGANISVLRRPARLQDLRRGSLRRHRERTRARATREQLAPTLLAAARARARHRSTASCAGICSTFSTGRPVRRSRRS